MKSKNGKYKILFLIISIVYLHFYFLLPLFHYHYQPENNFLEQEKFHSHLINGEHHEHEHEHESNENDHSIEDFSNPHHLVKLNSVELKPAKRIVDFRFPQQIVEYIPDNNTQNYSRCLIEILPECNLKWERYVRSTANISPPIS